MPLWGSAIYSPLPGHWLNGRCLVRLMCTQGTCHYRYVVERRSRSYKRSTAWSKQNTPQPPCGPANRRAGSPSGGLYEVRMSTRNFRAHDAPATGWRVEMARSGRRAAVSKRRVVFVRPGAGYTACSSSFPACEMLRVLDTVTIVRGKGHCKGSLLGIQPWRWI
jgi:hypothetical protein